VNRDPREIYRAVFDAMPSLVMVDISEIAELQRMIPICSVGKKVRDETESWSRLRHRFGLERGRSRGRPTAGLSANNMKLIRHDGSLRLRRARRGVDGR
jgi:hypothetical protein